MQLVSWVIVGVGLTAVPLTIDMVQVALPRSYRMGRLVGASQKPVLLLLVMALCAVAYFLLWDASLPYMVNALPSSQRRLLRALSRRPVMIVHAVAVSYLWINTCWAYLLCTTMGSSAPAPYCDSNQPFAPDDEGEALFPSHFCKACKVRVAAYDHHCPFTGGCVGLTNFRFFLVFALHGTIGMGYASYLSWWPFRDCVLRRIRIPVLGWPMPPPDDTACKELEARSLLLLPALALHAALCALLLLHLFMLANGLTTQQLSRLVNRRGAQCLLDFVQMRLRSSEGSDKWALVWGCPSRKASASWRLRVLLLPSVPSSARWPLWQGWAGGLGLFALLSLVVLLPLAYQICVQPEKQAQAISYPV
mmetsp:Transcript_834/g.1920  ORF Transcript_834/g.1920 Transcript_834/m.1920 type:complete len:363 (-) Transcript_834:60-1148(-)